LYEEVLSELSLCIMLIFERNAFFILKADLTELEVFAGDESNSYSRLIESSICYKGFFNFDGL